MADKSMYGNQAQYAAHANVSRAYVTQLKQDGKLVFDDEGNVDFLATDAKREAEADPARAKRDDAPVGEKDSASNGYAESRAKIAATEARIAEIKLAELEGRYIDRQEVVEAMVLAGRDIRQQLDGLLGKTDEIVAVVANGGGPQEVRQLLKSVVRDLEQKIADSLTGMGSEDEREDQNR